MLKRFKGDRWFHAHETARFDKLNGLPLASFKSRAYAIVIDFVLIWILRQIFHMNGSEHNEAKVGSIGYFLIEGKEQIVHLIESTVFFAIALKLGKGQTPGKKLMKICVVSLTEDSLGWWQSIERALGYGASLLEGGFGFVQYYINRNRQCVHDRIAETIVVDLRRPRAESAIDTDPQEIADEQAGLA